MYRIVTAIAPSRAPSKGRTRTALIAGALLAGTLAAGVAEAARFGVHVVDAAGEPVAGASVCIGLEGNYSQFGTAFTDARGEAPFVEVPEIPFVVTVSKTRFAGVRVAQPARGFDLIHQITLRPGMPGPRCKAGSTLAANPPPIDVLDVSVDGAASGAARLVPNIAGEPSHYRVGLDESLDGATWRAFGSTIDLPRELASAESVYLQFRTFSGRVDAWVEARSDIVNVPMPSR